MLQGAMFLSDAMMIPSTSLGTSLKQAGGEGGATGRGALGTRAAASGTSWVGPSWPLAGSGGASLGRGMHSLGMGTSPFGKSVDMVDVCTQLMEGARAVLPAVPARAALVPHTCPFTALVQASLQENGRAQRGSPLIVRLWRVLLHIRAHRTQLLHGQPAERVAVARAYCNNAQHGRGRD